MYHEASWSDTSKNQVWESEFKNLSELITSNNAAIEDWTPQEAFAAGDKKITC